MLAQHTPTYWRWFFLAAALEAGAALAALARIPSEGLSLARLLMFAFLGACTVLGVTFAFHPPPRLAALPRPAWSLLAGALAFLCALALFLLRYLDPALLPIFERLRPVLLFLLLFFLQACLFLLLLRNGLHPALLRMRLPLFRSWLAFFAALLVLLLTISLTRLGLTPDPAYWGEPGVAIQGWQLGLALVAGLLVFLFPARSRSSSILIPVALYLLAVSLWLSVPGEVLKNGFYVSLDPPSYQPFPYSDAAYYDSMAHSLLIGHPYQGEIPTRPLYIVLLAGLHLLFGERYDLVLVGQTMLLALIPLLLYWLGEKIHSRAAGLIAALFFIFRELVTLWISSETRVSNTRTLLVDLPTLLLVLLSCLFTLRWLERRELRSAMIAGGSLGLLLLLRTQSMLLVPAVLLMGALVFGLRQKTFYLQSGALLLGLALAVFPWLLHNYLQTGQVGLDAAFQYKLLGTQYAYTGNLDIGSFEYEGKSLGQILLQFLLKDPGFVLGFILNHFLAGWVGGMLALPLLEPFPGIFAPVNMYWMSWQGRLPWYNLLLLIAYLATIGLGLAAAWRRWRWIGLLPLVFNIGYSLATAIGRFSGWRYDLPADWVPYFYFAAGFAELLVLAGMYFGSKRAEPEPQTRTYDLEAWPRTLLLPAAVFLLLGALPWLAALPAPARYADQSRPALLAKLTRALDVPTRAQAEGFLADPDSVLVEGRLLYPRFFNRGSGVPSSNPWPAYASREYARIGFLLLNETRHDALFPTREPYDFPQGADAILLGCQREGYIEVRMLAFPALGTSFLSAPLSQSCAARDQ